MKTAYKIITPILALLLIPAVIWAPMFTFVMSPATEGEQSLAQNLGIKQQSSFYDLKTYYEKYESTLSVLFDQKEDVSGEEEKPGAYEQLLELLPSVKYLKPFNFFLAFDLLMMLAIVVTSVFTKKRWLAAIFGAAGLGSTMLMNVFFNKFAEPVLNGTSGLSAIVSKLGGDLFGALGSLAGESGLAGLASGSTSFLSGLTDMIVGRVTVFKLSTGYQIFLLIFALLTIFSIVAALALQEDD
ncbi:MAG: hypothetical protein K6C36_06830 [Clostridia bacterium]|nr:hypothetical protein [Clostridia bacterium]